MASSSSSGISRTPSGRDKGKAKGTRESLGGSPAAIRSPPGKKITGTSFVLVVCGAVDAARDGFIFVDFMAFCHFFMQRKADGRFLSCFPIDAHWGLLSKRGISDIKFGMNKYGEPLLTLTRKQAVDPKIKFWEEISASSLKAEVSKWINDTTKRAQPGDVVNIVFESHGDRHDGVRLGAHHMGMLEFSNLLKGFRPGVQVNAISGACYSGRFKEMIEQSGQKDRWFAAACGRNETAISLPRSVSDRARGSRFEQAWVQSFATLGGLEGPAESSDRKNFTVAEHESYIRDNVNRLFTVVEKKAQNPEFFSDRSSTLDEAVEELLMSDKVDILYDREITARRRRVEFPVENDQFFQGLINLSNRNFLPTAGQREAAKSFLANEAAKCDIDSGFEPHIMERQPPKNDGDLKNLMISLYYRGRIQSTFLDLFVVLCQKGFISVESLRLPVDFGNIGDNCMAVNDVFEIFEGIDKERQLHLGLPKNYPYLLWDWEFTFEALSWLSTMILRGFADAPGLFSTIEESAFLGKVNPKLADALGKKDKSKHVLKCDPEERAGGDSIPVHFGFWLPQGLGDGPVEDLYAAIAEAICRFDRIERAFKAFFNVPDKVVITAEQQSQVLDDHPELCPANLQKHLRNEVMFRKASGRQ